MNGPGFDMRGECAVKFRYKKAPRMQNLGLILFKCAFSPDFMLSAHVSKPHFSVKYSAYWGQAPLQRPYNKMTPTNKNHPHPAVPFTARYAAATKHTEEGKYLTELSPNRLMHSPGHDE